LFVSICSKELLYQFLKTSKGRALNMCSIGYGMFRAYFELRRPRFLGRRSSYSEEGTTITYYLLDDGLDISREVLTLKPNERWYMEGDIEVIVPFQVADWLISLPDGRFILGLPESAQLIYYSEAGYPEFVVEGPWIREPVTRADRARWLARIAERRPHTLAYARKAELPDRHGAFASSPVVDSSGRLWLSRTVNPWAETGEVVSYRYDVFEPDGTWIGSQDLPFPPGRLKIRGRYLYYEDPGDDMVGPRIRRFELVPLFGRQTDALPVSNPSDKQGACSQHALGRDANLILLPLL